MQDFVQNVTDWQVQYIQVHPQVVGKAWQFRRPCPSRVTVCLNIIWALNRPYKTGETKGEKK